MFLLLYRRRHNVRSLCPLQIGLISHMRFVLSDGAFKPKPTKKYEHVAILCVTDLEDNLGDFQKDFGEFVSSVARTLTEHIVQTTHPGQIKPVGCSHGPNLMVCYMG